MLLSLLVHFNQLVSILVLMDILLLPSAARHYYKRFRSFNPCFNGYTTFTQLLDLKLTMILKVSILVLMDILLLRFPQIIHMDIYFLVSILVLMDILLLHMTVSLKRDLSVSVSILVLMDILLLQSNISAIVFSPSKFQSLF